MKSGPMHTKVVIRVGDSDAARSVSGYLGEALVPEPLAVTSFEDGLTAHKVEAYFDIPPDLPALDRALAELGIPGLAPALAEIVPDENWVEISQAALPPVQAGRFVVHGSHDADKVGGSQGAILIDAGEAFGTAHHATTLGCLLAIDRLARRHAFKRVLDLGCGTGVLAIAAAMVMPRAHVMASDIDPIATEVAAANARANGFGRRIGFVTATGLDHPRLKQPHDLIIANILARPLIALAPRLARAVEPGGRLVLSGLLATQAAEVFAHYRASGFTMERRQDLTGWSILTLVAR
jgi:ribosomal protein L11 methyltransferase